MTDDEVQRLGKQVIELQSDNAVLLCRLTELKAENAGLRSALNPAEVADLKALAAVLRQDHVRKFFLLPEMGLNLKQDLRDHMALVAELRAENERLRAALRKIADGSWNEGKSTAMDSRSFARHAAQPGA